MESNRPTKEDYIEKWCLAYLGIGSHLIPKKYIRFMKRIKNIEMDLTKHAFIESSHKAQELLLTFATELRRSGNE